MYRDRAGNYRVGWPAWLAVLAALSVLLPHPSTAGAQPAPCIFTLGFKALRDQIPEIVGDCLENERFNLENGNAEQRTVRGLLVWRKADNWTVFTDGYTTWINGPLGVVSRPNLGPLFPWEGGGDTRTPVSLPNGTELVPPSGPGGLGQLKIVNGTPREAALKLVEDVPGRPLRRYVYVRANAEVSLLEIAAGSYRVLFTQGLDWDEAARAFRNDASYAEFVAPLEFVEQQTPEGTRYSIWTVTLQPTLDGNAPVEPIDAQAFGRD